MFGFLSKDVATSCNPNTARYAGCFGKLPAYPEFIRHNLSSREALALDTWVQEGVSLITRSLGAGWKDYLLKSPPLNFLLVGHNEIHTLSGIISPSHDKSGRGYPFGIFAAVESEVFSDMQALSVVAFGKYINSSVLFSDSARTASNVRNAVSVVEDSIFSVAVHGKRDLISGEVSALGGINIGEFWGSILPGADYENRAVFVKTIMTTLNAVTRRTPQRVHWGVRFPLPSKGDVSTYVLFWLQLCENVIGSHGWRAQCYWHGSHQGMPARLSVFFRPIPPSYMASLLDSSRNDGSILDVVEEMKTSVNGVSRIVSVVKDESYTLMDALNRWRIRDIDK